MRAVDWFLDLFSENPIIVALVITGLIVAGAVWYDYRHPCIKRGPGTCGGDTYCMIYDSKMNCEHWAVNPTYPCEVCVERAP